MVSSKKKKESPAYLRNKIRFVQYGLTVALNFIPSPRTPSPPAPSHPTHLQFSHTADFDIHNSNFFFEPEQIAQAFSSRETAHTLRIRYDDAHSIHHLKINKIMYCCL